MGHFFPSYTFDLDRTLYFFTAGRYEYRNKGIDLFIEAMYRLNQRLKRAAANAADGRRVHRHPGADAATSTCGVLQNQSMFDDLRNTCAEIEQQMGRRLFHSAATGRLPTYQELLPDDAQVRLKRAMHAWRTHRQPPIVTHDLVDDAGDPVAQAPAPPRPVQRRRRPGEDRLPPRVRDRDEPADQPGLRAVRPRLPPGHLPELLRAVGLHADGVRSRWACRR